MGHQNKIGRAIKHMLFGLSPSLAARLDIKFEIKTADRLFLEGELFTYLNEQYGPNADILFIGIDRYNWHYPRLLMGNFHSIDLNPRNKRYGIQKTHTTGSATELTRYYPNSRFDIVIANGLVGYGIDTVDAFDAVLRGCHALLRTQGMLIIGYNDTPDLLSFDPSSAPCMQHFKMTIPAIPGVDNAYHRTETKTNHTFIFLQKR
jgi:hypothetical protein|tara:strand:- start:3834 stop:4448 length:615 start_codon:yes stop_codon:yes gene_type:complete